MKYKRFISLLTSFSILCSMTLSNVNTAFAESTKTVTIINEDENGKLQFLGNYEDVYKEVDNNYFEVSLDDLNTEEITEISNETISEETSTESINEESSETNTEVEVTDESTVEVTDESTIKDVEISEEVESTSEFIEESTDIIEETSESVEESTEIVEETSELIEDNVVLDTTVTDTEKVTIVDPECKKVIPGETVILEAIPNEGYSVSAIFITTEKGKSVNYSFKDNKISFVMPNSNVNIKAMFSDSLSEIVIDDSVIDNSTYIRSNLNSDYVSLNKFEVVNAMIVKQTVIDDTILKQNGLESTIDNLWSQEDFIYNALINFQLTNVKIVDVDENSNYYVAFINTMQNDNSEVTDCLVANSNNNAEKLDDCIYDYNTGILYINKDYVVKLDSNSTKDEINNSLSMIQTQLLNVTTSTSHNINLIVNDENQVLDIESGVIEVDTYDTNISIKLNKTNNSINNDVNIKINDISYGTFNLLENSQSDYINYDKDSNILTITNNAISITDIEITVLDENYKNNEDFIINADTLNNITSTNGPTWKLNSGTASLGYNIYTNPTKLYLGYDINTGDYLPYVHTTNSDWNAEAGQMWDWIQNGNNSNVLNRSVEIKKSVLSYNLNFSSFTNFTIGSGNWSITDYSGDAKLACAHVLRFLSGEYNSAAPDSGYIDTRKVGIRILKVDTTNKKIVWAAIVSTSHKQAGLGLFVSNYTETYGEFSFSKKFISGVDSDPQIDSSYKIGNVTDAITIKEKTTGTVVATIKIAGKDSTNTSYAILDATIKNSSYASIKSGDNSNTVHFNLVPGTYIISETKRPSNWSKAPDKEITISRGGSSSYTMEDYPVFYSLNGQKLNDLNQAKNVKGAEFYLYYSKSNFYLTNPVFNDLGDKLESFKFINNSSNFTSVTVSEKENDLGTNIYRVATFTANDSGILVPSISGCYGSLYTPYTSTFGKDFKCPQINGNILDYCPAGYYILVEVKAPEGYIITDKINKSNGTLNSDVSYIYQKLDTSNPDQNARTTAESISLTANNTTVKSYTITRASDGTFKIKDASIPTNAYGAWSMLNSVGGSLGVTVSNSTYTFSRNNNPVSIEGAKRISKFNNETTHNDIDSDGDGFDFFDQAKTFTTRFTNKVSYKGATYNLYYTYNNKEYQIATGVSDKLVTGYEDNPYKIKWTLTNICTSTFPNIYLSSDSYRINGLVYGSTMRVEETQTSKGTIKSSEQVGNNTFTLDALHKAIPTKATSNSIQSLKITVNKEIILNNNDVIHSGSKLIKTITEDEIINVGSTTDTELDPDNNTQYRLKVQGKTIEGTYISATYKLTFENASEEDRKLYFKGLSFDLWYNPMISGYSYSNMFLPHSTVKDLATTTYTIDNYTITNKQNSSTSYPDKWAQRVGTFKYVTDSNTNKVVLKAERYTFPVYTSNTEIAGTYTCWIENNNTLAGLPSGAYALYETSNNDATKLNTSPKYQYIEYTKDALITNITMSMSNYTSVKPANFKLYKISEFDNTVNFDGTIYKVYWSADENLIYSNPTTERFRSNFSYNDDYSYTPTDLHYVGQINIISKHEIGYNGMPYDTHEVIDNGDKTYFGYIKYNFFGNLVDANGDWSFSVAGPDIHINNGEPLYVGATSEQLDGMQYLKKLATDPTVDSTQKIDLDTAKKLKLLAKYQVAIDHMPDYALYSSNVTDFYGPGFGTYVIVESHPVEGQGYTDPIIYTADKLSDIEITAVEPTVKDPLDIKLDKISPFWDTVKSIEGTKFKVDYYFNEFHTEDSHSNILDEFKDKTPTTTLYFNAKDVIDNGKLNGFDIALDTTYLDLELSSDNYNNYFDSKDRIQFSQGTVIISEITNDNYTQEDFDTFKYETNDFGKNLIVELRPNDSELDTYIKLKSGSDWYNKTNEAEITLTLNNTGGEPFSLSKTDFNNNIDNATFELVLVEDNVEVKVWQFTTVEGNFSSLNSTEFSDCNGRPLADGKNYILREVDSDNKYLRQWNFTYESGKSISNFMNTSNKISVVNYPEPKMTSKATATDTSSQAAISKSTETTVRDTVSITNLVKGNIYVVEGIAVDITDIDNPVFMKDSNGMYITASTMFYANDTNMEVDVLFTFNSSTIEDKTINFYEYLAFVKNVDSEYQYNNYVDGSVSNIPTGTLTEIFGENNYVKADTQNKLTISNNQLNLSGKGFIYNLDKTNYVSHADKTDVNQNIYYPKIETDEKDRNSDSHYSGKHYGYIEDNYWYGDILIVDSVNVTNVANGTYMLQYEVIANNTVIDNGSVKVTARNNKIITNIRTLINTDSDDFYFTEKLYTLDNVLIASHTDKVVSQTGYVSKINTTAQNKIDSKKLVLSGTTATVKDIVEYKNFNTNDNYTILGYLVDKDTNKIISESIKMFSPTESNDSATLEFTFDSTGMDGKTLVVYEFAFDVSSTTLFSGYMTNKTYGLDVGEIFDDKIFAYNESVNNSLIARHYDNGDANQTIYIPKVSTTVITPKKVQPNESVTITDKVSYENLIKNDSYKLVGFLVDTKNTETEADDTVITRSTNTFTALDTSGDTSINFTFNANNYINSTIVVYEYVYNGTFNDNQLPTYTEGTLFSSIDIPTNVNGITLVGKHADSTDDKQTFIVTSTPIKITKQSYEGNILSGASLKLTNLTTNTVLGEWSSTTTGKDFNLTPGDYVLEETKAPNGKALTLPIYFTVKEVNNNYIAVYTGTETELEYTLVTDNNITIKQYNLAIKDPNLMALPTAGGIGTTPYIIIGLMLMSIAIVFKKKKYYI